MPHVCFSIAGRWAANFNKQLIYLKKSTQLTKSIPEEASTFTEIWAVFSFDSSSVVITLIMTRCASRHKCHY